MTPSPNTPFELLFDQLRDIHSMEVQLGASMPQLLTLATNTQLREIIGRHARQNHHQVAEVVAIFAAHGESPGDDKCKAIAGLIEGGNAHLVAVRSPQIRDLMMIAHCLRIEYYEMAAYEVTTLLARRLGLMREIAILGELLAEEKEMSVELMQLEPNLFETSIS